MGRLLEKLTVEAGRLRSQLKALLSYPLEPGLIRQHDRTFAERAVQTPGQRPLGRKIAIFLIYQPKALLRSTLETCRTLSAKGYSVLVMSNAALSPSDHAELAPLVWRTIERPNFGYDFGGYRDGIRVLRDLRTAPEALIILNDSVWWPVFGDDTLIDRMEAGGKDVMGTILHQLSPRYGRPRPPFLESFFYWFGPRVTASAVFWRFWDRYRVSSLKYNAIHRGERLLTGALIDAGLSAAGLFTAADLIAALAKAGHDEQVRALTHAAFTDSAFAEAARRLLAAPQKTGAWSAEVLNFVALVTEKRIFHPTFPYASMKLLHANYLKKTPSEPDTSVHYQMRARVLAAIAAGDLPEPLSAVKVEIEQRQSAGATADLVQRGRAEAARISRKRMLGHRLGQGLLRLVGAERYARLREWNRARKKRRKG